MIEKVKASASIRSPPRVQCPPSNTVAKNKRDELMGGQEAAPEEEKGAENGTRPSRCASPTMARMSGLAPARSLSAFLPNSDSFVSPPDFSNLSDAGGLRVENVRGSMEDSGVSGLRLLRNSCNDSAGSSGNNSGESCVGGSMDSFQVENGSASNGGRRAHGTSMDFASATESMTTVMFESMQDRNSFAATTESLSFDPDPTTLALPSSFAASLPLLPFGVLGQQLDAAKSMVTKAPAPHRVGSGGCVFVDPAGLHHIQPPGGPSNAHGAAGAIYKAIGIHQDECFPDDVVEAVTHTGNAKFHRYQPKQQIEHDGGGDDSDGLRGEICVIHAVGPDLRKPFVAADHPAEKGGVVQRDGVSSADEAPVEATDDAVLDWTKEQAVSVLARTYRNILSEFVGRALQEAEEKGLSPPSLRLLPISGGIFSGAFLKDMPGITFEALQLGFDQLDPRQQRLLLSVLHGSSSKIGLCIFSEKELPLFLAAGFSLSGNGCGDLGRGNDEAVGLEAVVVNPAGGMEQQQQQKKKKAPKPRRASAETLSTRGSLELYMAPSSSSVEDTSFEETNSMLAPAPSLSSSPVLSAGGRPPRRSPPMRRASSGATKAPLPTSAAASNPPVDGTVKK